MTRATLNEFARAARAQATESQPKVRIVCEALAGIAEKMAVAKRKKRK